MSNNVNEHISNIEWRIFPPTSPCYKHGDEVFIRPKSNNEIGKYGRVIIEQQPTTSAGGNNSGDNHRKRLTVEIKPSHRRDNKKSSKTPIKEGGQQAKSGNQSDQSSSFQTSFRPVRLIHRYHNVVGEGVNKNKECKIIITAKTNHYRILAASQLHQKDIVLEIGCSNGECSLIIAKYCEKFIGYDTSSEMITQARGKMEKKVCSKGDHYKNCTFDFHTIDPFMDPKKASKLAQGANVVFIDIGGNRDLGSVLRMIQWSRENLAAVNLIIIKSEEMVQSINDAAQLNRNVSTLGDDDNGNHDSNNTATPKKKIKRSRHSSVCIDKSTGLLNNCEGWFSECLEEEISNCKKKSNSKGPPQYSHPLKAPMAISPSDGITPICRYYNYHKNGCKKLDCEFDHEHCHWCLQKGHIALTCQNPAGKLN